MVITEPVEERGGRTVKKPVGSVLVFHGCITDLHKFSGLKMFILFICSAILISNLLIHFLKTHLIRSYPHRIISCLISSKSPDEGL